MKHCCCKNDDCKKTLWMILAIIGFVATVAGIAYAIYRYCTPDYLDEFDDYDDDLDDLDDDFESVPADAEDSCECDK